MTSANKAESVLRFDTAIYPQEALMGAAYKFLDRVYTHFEYEGESKTISAKLRAKTQITQAHWENLLEAFSEEALSQALRLKILKATRKTRDQIMSIALYCIPSDESAMEQQTQQCAQSVSDEKMDSELEEILRKLKEEPDDDNHEEDPMDITVPWEEKYGGENL